jgi:hypothetical protein
MLTFKTLMNTFNLMQVVYFSALTATNKGKLIDIIFLDTMKYGKTKIKPTINGLSDHNTQIISLENINNVLKKNDFKRRIRLINEQTIKNFQTLLKDESWGLIYNVRKSDDMFNHFQSIHVRHFETSFPVSYIDDRLNVNNWITKATGISCSKKRELYSI